MSAFNQIYTHGSLHVNYVKNGTPYFPYGGCTGWSIDNVNGKIIVTVGYWSSHGGDWHWGAIEAEGTAILGLVELQNTSVTGTIMPITQVASTTSRWQNIARFVFTTTGLKYALPTNGNILRTNGWDVLGSSTSPDGIDPGPGQNWMIAAKWDGANNIVIFCNKAVNSLSGDTGTYMTETGINDSFASLAGYSNTQVYTYHMNQYGGSWSWDTVSTPKTSLSINFR
jgi:hypothetical protein